MVPMRHAVQTMEQFLKLPGIFKLTNTERFAAWFVVSGDATADEIRGGVPPFHQESAWLRQIIFRTVCGVNFVMSPPNFRGYGALAPHRVAASDCQELVSPPPENKHERGIRKCTQGVRTVTLTESNNFTEMCNGAEGGSHSRLLDFLITQL